MRCADSHLPLPLACCVSLPPSLRPQVPLGCCAACFRKGQQHRRGARQLLRVARPYFCRQPLRQTGRPAAGRETDLLAVATLIACKTLVGSV